MTGKSRRDEVNAEILECVSELIGRVIGHGEQMAQKLGIPAPFIKALHTLDCPMAMKDLGKRMHCDPSFVTIVADMLEKRGLARREQHPADRRVKNLVLTDDGLTLRRRLELEFAARMPWGHALSDDERGQLLALIRKMLSADDEHAMDSLDGLDTVLVNALQDAAQHDTPSSPPALTGEVSTVVSKAPAAR
jgi:DNA-binding MarR family transcriptional regulator